MTYDYIVRYLTDVSPSCDCQQTVFSRTQDAVLSFPLRLLCNLFDHDLKEPGPAAFFAGSGGKRCRNRAYCRRLSTRRHPVLVSGRRAFGSFRAKASACCFRCRVFMCAAVLPVYFSSGLVNPGQVFPRDRNRNPRSGYLCRHCRTIPGEQRTDARAVRFGNAYRSDARPACWWAYPVIFCLLSRAHRVPDGICGRCPRRGAGLYPDTPVSRRPVKTVGRNRVFCLQRKFCYILFEPSSPRHGLIDMATYFAFGAFETFLPLLLASRSIGAGETGIIFAVQVLIIAGTKPLFGKLADRIDKRIQIAAGILILGCSVAVIPLMHTFGEFLAVSSILGFGMSLSTIATSAYVAEVSKKEHVGASMGALLATMDIGHAGGPLITGIIITVMGYAAGFFTSFILAILVAVIFAVSVRGTVK